MLAKCNIKPILFNLIQLNIDQFNYLENVGYVKFKIQQKNTTTTIIAQKKMSHERQIEKILPV